MGDKAHALAARFAFIDEVGPSVDPDPDIEYTFYDFCPGLLTRYGKRSLRKDTANWLKTIFSRNPDGFWTGRLSTSALATSVAIVALRLSGEPEDAARVDAGFSWLCRNINADGGYGDTPESLSNVSTTLLCYSAVHFCRKGDAGDMTLGKMERWLSAKGIEIGSPGVVKSILDVYGRDYTFSVPILSMLTLCGVLPQSSLSGIHGLPFELTLLPASFYRFLNLRVVSYALPALIGVGIYLHRKRSSLRSLFSRIREKFVRPA